MNVLIRNLPDDTGEAEIRDLMLEHGVPVTKVTLTSEGDAERLVAVVALDTDNAGAQALVKMVDGKYWRERTLSARAMTHFTGEGLNKP